MARIDPHIKFSEVLKLLDVQVEKSQSGTRRQHTPLASHRAVTKLTLVCLWCIIGYHYKTTKIKILSENSKHRS